MSVAAAVPLGGTRASRWPLVVWGGVGLLAALAFLAAGWIGIPSGTTFTVCGFRRITGIPCPGCGMTRAMAALARGDLMAALRFHPFAPLVLAQAVALWGAVGAAVVRHRPFTLPPRLLERLVVWQGAAFLALWIERLATGTLPW